MYVQEAHDLIDQKITFQVPNLPSISNQPNGPGGGPGGAGGAQAARNAVITDGANGGTYSGNGDRNDYRGGRGGHNSRQGGRNGGRNGGPGDGAGGRTQKEPEKFDSKNRHAPHSDKPTPGRQQRQKDSPWDPTCGVWFWDKTRWMRQCVAGDDGKINAWHYCDICGNHGHKPELCAETGEADATDGASVRSGQSSAQTLAINVNALRAGLDGLPPGQEEIMLEVDEDGVQYINT